VTNKKTKVKKMSKIKKRETFKQ